MIGTLLRIILVVIIVAAAAAFFFGYQFGDRGRVAAPDEPIGTTGETVHADRAREVGARVGGAVAEGAEEAQRVAADAALTAKIKAKMVLDDRISAAVIDVDTLHGVVTLTGTVGSQEQKERAVRHARETDGVQSVVDQLAIR